MSRDGSTPFGRGEYSTADLSHLLGREYQFEDVDYTVSSSNIGAKKNRSGKMVTCRLVRNDAGFALEPKRLVIFSTAVEEFNAVVDGYARTGAVRSFPVDEFIPSAGVPDGAYFYIVVKGPAMILTPIAGAEFNGDISIGTRIVALTAATSGATTAGRGAVMNITGSSQATDYTFLMDNVIGRIGHALSAKTTGNTNADLLVDVGKW